MELPLKTILRVSSQKIDFLKTPTPTKTNTHNHILDIAKQKMPKGKKTASSTTRSMCAYECASCGRIFTNHNRKLACKLVKLHAKKCWTITTTPKPKIQQLWVNTDTLKKHCDTLIKSHNRAFIQDDFHIV